jgi:hypothetical protein
MNGAEKPRWSRPIDNQTKGTSIMSTTQPGEARKPQTPSHNVYQVKDREGKKGFWTKLGVAFAHADGQGFNIQLEAVPLDGRLVLRVASEKKE